MGCFSAKKMCCCMSKKTKHHVDVILYRSCLQIKKNPALIGCGYSFGLVGIIMSMVLWKPAIITPEGPDFNYYQRKINSTGWPSKDIDYSDISLLENKADYRIFAPLCQDIRAPVIAFASDIKDKAFVN